MINLDDKSYIQIMDENFPSGWKLKKKLYNTCQLGLVPNLIIMFGNLIKINKNKKNVVWGGFRLDHVGLICPTSPKTYGPLGHHQADKLAPHLSQAKFNSNGYRSFTCTLPCFLLSSLFFSFSFCSNGLQHLIAPHHCFFFLSFPSFLSSSYFFLFFSLGL